MLDLIRPNIIILNIRSLLKSNDVFISCHLVQVKVVDRTAVVTANAETEVVSPPGIQEAINMLTGTIRDISRVYYF